MHWWPMCPRGLEVIAVLARQFDFPFLIAVASAVGDHSYLDSGELVGDHALKWRGSRPARLTRPMKKIGLKRVMVLYVAHLGERSTGFLLRFLGPIRPSISAMPVLGQVVR